MSLTYREILSMKGSTEYRDAYCWFFGGREQTPDNFEEMIKQKIAGTFNEENWGGNRGLNSFGDSFSEKSVWARMAVSVRLNLSALYNILKNSLISFFSLISNFDRELYIS